MNKRTFVLATALAASLLASGVSFAETTKAAVSYVTAPFNVPQLSCAKKAIWTRPLPPMV